MSGAPILKFDLDFVDKKLVHILQLHMHAKRMTCLHAHQCHHMRNAHQILYMPLKTIEIISLELVKKEPH